MSPNVFRPPETQDGAEAIWQRQESLRSGAGLEDDADDDLYRHVFAALREEATPMLSEDFAAEMAADAQRLADARAQVVRFRRMMASLLSLCYLPAMLGIAMLHAAPWVESMVQTPVAERSLLLWLVASLVLGLLVSGLDGMERKRDAGLSD